MHFAEEPRWDPVDRAAFQAWLTQLPADEPLGMAGGYTRHPVAYYLNHRSRGHWCVEVRCGSVWVMDRDASFRMHEQRGWLVNFCWRLKKPDAYGDVSAADCLAVLLATP